jgi:hypothetical protein
VFWPRTTCWTIQIVEQDDRNKSSAFCGVQKFLLIIIIIIIIIIMPITVTERSETRIFFDHLNTRVVARMSVCFYSVSVFSYVGSGLATCWSPIQGVLPTVHKINSFVSKWEKIWLYKWTETGLSISPCLFNDSYSVADWTEESYGTSRWGQMLFGSRLEIWTLWLYSRNANYYTQLSILVCRTMSSAYLHEFTRCRLF